MDKKMMLNVEDESYPALISKKFWKHVKSKSKLTKIPKTVWYGNRYRNNITGQANLYNEFFYDQFSEEINYNIGIDIGSNDQFSDLRFRELDVQILLKWINPEKAAGPDKIHGIILKNCAASLA